MFYNLKIKTIIACLLSMCLAVRCMASPVLWFGIPASSVIVLQDGSTTTLQRYKSLTGFNTVEIVNSSRNNEILLIYDKDMGEYEGILEFEDGMSIDDWPQWTSAMLYDIMEAEVKPEEEIGHQPPAQSIDELDITYPNGEDQTIQILLGYVDWETYDEIWDAWYEGGEIGDEPDFVFDIFAISDEKTIKELFDENHIGFGEIIPPNFDQWIPDYFSLIPVPEPSIPIFTMLGICAILIRRKNGQ